jgi:prevent-host-death family protein
MITVGAFEAKTNLSSLLERVAQGESVRITRHGKPIARIVPDDPEVSRPELIEVISAIREFRRGRHFKPNEIRALIDEGRRY